jgi:hypothetical protein
MDYLPVVISASYVKDYTIQVTFDNGEQKVVDCSKWLNGGIFESLKEKEEFKKFFVDGWTIAWPNGADIAPETLYRD